MLQRYLIFAVAVVSFAHRCDDDGKYNIPNGLGSDQVFDNHVEVNVGFENEGTKLFGRLYLPKSKGPHPVMVHHFGSDKWTTFEYNSDIQASLDEGLGLLFYDKRGVGRSQGECCPYQEVNYFERLAGDIAAAIRVIRAHPMVDPHRIGLYGFSQGGWIVPIVAADTSMQIGWVVIGSGPTVTLGEELFYSKASGDSDCKLAAKTEDQLNELMDQKGPSGFDPQPFLLKLSCPVIWVFGGLDRSIPVKRSIEIIRSIQGKYKRDFTVIIKPNWNHCWVENGKPCQCSGPRGDQYFLFEWIKQHAGLR